MHTIIDPDVRWTPAPTDDATIEPILTPIRTRFCRHRLYTENYVTVGFVEMKQNALVAPMSPQSDLTLSKPVILRFELSASSPDWEFGEEALTLLCFLRALLQRLFRCFAFARWASWE